MNDMPEIETPIMPKAATHHGVFAATHEVGASRQPRALSHATMRRTKYATSTMRTLVAIMVFLMKASLTQHPTLLEQWSYRRNNRTCKALHTVYSP